MFQYDTGSRHLDKKRTKRKEKDSKVNPPSNQISKALFVSKNQFIYYDNMIKILLLSS